MDTNGYPKMNITCFHQNFSTVCDGQIPPISYNSRHQGHSMMYSPFLDMKIGVG